MQKRAKLFWWLLSSTLFFIFLSIGLYLLSPLIAQKGLEYWLQEQDFSHVELVMRPPTWNTLRIEKLKLQKNQADKQLSFSTENILLSFTPVDLYLRQRLSLIQLPQSDISITYLTDSVETEESSELIDLSNLLPKQWFSKIPVDLIQVGELNLNLNYPSDTIADWQFSGALLFDGEELYSRVKFFRNSKDLGWGDLKLGSDNHFYLRLLENDVPFLTIDGALSYTEQLQLDSTQQIEIDGLQRWGTALFPSKIMAGRPQVTAIPTISGHLETQGSTYFPLRTQLTPDALLRSIQTQQKVTANLHTLKPTAGIDQANAELSGTINYSLSQLAASIDKKSTITLHNIHNATFSKPIEKAKIQLHNAVNIDVNLSKIRLGMPISPQIKPFDLAIHTSTVNLPQVEIMPTTLTLHLQQLDLIQWDLKGQADIQNLAIKWQKQQQPLLNLATHFQLSKEQLSNHFSLNSTDLPFSLSGKTATNMANLDSRFSWKLKPINLATINKPLHKYFSTPPELSLKSGTLFHNGNGQFKNNKLSGQANNSIRQATIGWDESLIEQVDLDSKTTLYPSGKLIDTGNIKLGKVTKGIEITKVTASYSYTKERSKRRGLITLKALSADVLGGRVQTEDLQFDPFNPEISTQVDIDRLDLGEILKLEQQQGLSGEGKLSGSFPLQYKNGEISVNDGKLLSLAPGGKIMFLPSASVAAYAAVNIGLKTAIEALENFHFEQLNIRLNYTPDGTALLTTRLKGRNPGWQNGRPVDFTINIEENILNLIKTLQLADKLTRTIEKRYR